MCIENIVTICIVISLIIFLIIMIINNNNKYSQESFDNSFTKNDYDILIRYLDFFEKKTNNIVDIKKVYKEKLGNVPIYVINLPKSIKRYNNIIKQISKYGLENVNIIEAVNGRKINTINSDVIHFELNNNYIKYVKYSDHVEKKEEIGCTLSHLNCMKIFYDSFKNHHDYYFRQNNYVLICEDDVSFMFIPYVKSIKEIVNNAPTDWEIISLYGWCYGNTGNNKYINHSNADCVMAAAYLINLNGCKKVLDYLYDKNKNMYILRPSINNKSRNYILADYLSMDICNSYLYKDPIIVPINDYGTLNSTIHENHTDLQLANALVNIKSIYNNHVLNLHQ